MAVGQAVLTSTLDVGALNAVEARLEVSATAECAAHGVLLREVLELHRVLSAAGAGLATTAQLALLRQVSEQAAQALLVKAELLASLPGGLEALDCGLLTVEQSTVLTRLLAPHGEVVRARVWQRLQTRLIAALDGGAVLPPARFSSLLRDWVIAADPRDAVERRKAAEADGDVDYRRRDDGLVDLFANGLTGAVAQAVLQRIRARAGRFGTGDDRSAGKRRLDALVDLLLGRDRLGGDGLVPDGRGDDVAAHCGPSCGCRLGSPVPCGTDVSVLLPIGTALDTTDELATLVGHGPLEPDLTELLLSAPRIRPVWVDADGVPLAVGECVTVPPRGDPAALRELLQRLAATAPPVPQPRHPGDHRTPDPGGVFGPTARSLPRARPHPAGTSRGYRVPAALRRLLQVRAPRCEWPGCGVPAHACDVDHDVAWPAGPTCSCNCGPLCRRHHRLKQLLMRKSRGARSSVTWTDPTGRRWTSPSQHATPTPAVRPPRPLPQPDVHVLSPQALAELLAADDDAPVRFELRHTDADPDEPETDRLAARLDIDDGRDSPSTTPTAGPPERIRRADGHPKTAAAQ